MTSNIDMMNASLKALMQLLDGETDMETRTARILYNAFAGWDDELVRACCEATYEQNYDGVLVAFDPACVERGPLSILVSVPEGGLIKLQRGRLWMTPRGGRAVLVPQNVGKAHGHYAVERGRIVQRKGWPAETLARGMRRAEARLAELTANNLRSAQRVF